MTLFRSLALKAKIGMIEVWHNENLPQGTNTIRMKWNNIMKPVNIW
jgi:transcriptional regulator